LKSFEAGVTVVSSSPAVLKGVQDISLTFLTSADVVVLKYNSIDEVDLTFADNLISKAVDVLSNTTGLVT